MTCGIILSAGLSSRMYDFKAMLSIGDTTFIKKIIHEMREAGVSEVIVVTGFKHDELEDHIRDEEVTCVYNEHFSDTQMLDSLKLGLAALPEDCESVLITPVDVVLPSLKVYQNVLGGTGDFVRPVCRGRYGHPVLMRRKLFSFVENYDGDGGLKGAVQASKMITTDVEVDEENITLDADTPEDYQRVREEYENSRLQIEINAN